VSVTENKIEQAEKAVEAIVYGTVGLALYLRDTAPSFLKLFVARGKNELGHQISQPFGQQFGQTGKAVGDPLAQVRNLGDLAAQNAPQILRVVGDQVSKLRERAEDVIAGFGTAPPDAADPPPYSPAPPHAPSAAPAPPPSAPAPPSATADGVTTVAGEGSPTSWRSMPGAPAPTTADAAPGLAITDYDELSASQVVDRLEGLPRHELEAIRDYERAHRARNTILGKIEQLTR
jgi:hypothetical protein